MSRQKYIDKKDLSIEGDIRDLVSLISEIEDKISANEYNISKAGRFNVKVKSALSYNKGKLKTALRKLKYNEQRTYSLLKARFLSVKVGKQNNDHIAELFLRFKHIYEPAVYYLQKYDMAGNGAYTIYIMCDDIELFLEAKQKRYSSSKEGFLYVHYNNDLFNEDIDCFKKFEIKAFAALYTPQQKIDKAHEYYLNATSTEKNLISWIIEYYRAVPKFHKYAMELNPYIQNIGRKPNVRKLMSKYHTAINPETQGDSKAEHVYEYLTEQLRQMKISIEEAATSLKEIDEFIKRD